MPIAWLYLVVPIQAGQGGLSDVDLPAKKEALSGAELCGVSALPISLGLGGGPRDSQKHTLLGISGH